MILAIFFIILGLTVNQSYSSDNSLILQQKNTFSLSSAYKPIAENYYSYGSIQNNDYDDFHIHYTKSIPTPTPKDLYFEYRPDDPYEQHETTRTKDRHKCKKATCGTICCSLLSVIGCLLFHQI